MSKYIVTDNQTLVLIVNHPAHTNEYGRKVTAWRGSLECSADNYTIDQIIAHATSHEFIERVLRIGGEGVVDITEEVLTYAEGNG